MLKQFGQLTWLVIPFIAIAFALQVSASPVAPDNQKIEHLDRVETEKEFLTGGTTENKEVTIKINVRRALK